MKKVRALGGVKRVSNEESFSNWEVGRKVKCDRTCMWNMEVLVIKDYLALLTGSYRFYQSAAT